MSSRGRCGSSARVRSMPRSMCAVTHEDSTMSTAPETLTLPQLMQAAQEAEKADSALATVKKASADAVAAATAKRNKVIAEANARHEQATADFQSAIRRAGDEQDAALAKAAEARDAAQADYLAACRVADPLLQELQVRSERISRVVGRST